MENRCRVSVRAMSICVVATHWYVDFQYTVAAVAAVVGTHGKGTTPLQDFVFAGTGESLHAVVCGPAHFLSLKVVGGW